MNHEYYMNRALKLAAKGAGFVSPNPMVGAVIVKDNHIIGEGWHEFFGGPHAERNAIASCKESPKGATMYVTLEPCCHYGKTPPCTDGIIAAGITRVVAGMTDPNEQVSGKGLGILEENGIEAICGVLEDECKKQNEIFLHYITEKTPFVIMKYAMTADGKIATATGDSQWITSEKARERVHETRHMLSGIMVGIGTVLADDPLLTCRLPDRKNPVRIICDSNLDIPLSSRIIKTASEVPTIIATVSKSKEKRDALEMSGVTIICTPEKDGKVDLIHLMKELGALGIDSILLEGGGTLNSSALEAGIVKKLHVYMGAKLTGGVLSLGPVRGKGVEKMIDSINLNLESIETIENDVFVAYGLEG